MAKFDLLLVEIENTNPAIIVITETWLQPNIPNSLINIPNFTLYRKDRQLGTLGYGGVAVYVSNEYQSIKVASSLNVIYNNDTNETLWINIQIHPIKLLLIAVYRPPHSTIQNDTLIYEKIKEASFTENILILGDFNLPHIKWPLTRNDYRNTADDLFIDMYLESNLSQFVDRPTRYRVLNNPSILDLVLSNDENLVTEIKYDQPIGKSDHLTLQVSLQLYVHLEQKHYQPRRNYWKANYNEINRYIENFDLTELSVETSIEGKWSIFKDMLNTAIEKFVPLSKNKSKKQIKKPWITNDIIDLINNKRKLWDNYKRNQTDENYSNYRTENNLITDKIRHSRQQHETNIASGSNKAFYSYIQKHICSKSSTPSSIDNNGVLTQNATEIANIFARQFTQQYVTEPDNNIPEIEGLQRAQNSFVSINITQDKVKKVLMNLKNDSAPGPDQISSYFLKNTASVVSQPLAEIMQTSLELGILPKDWKMASVTPIYKKGNKKMAANYRAISLTSIPCKCMERIITNELLEFLTAENVLPEEQHGFIPGRSVVTNLLLNLHAWTNEFDVQNPIDVLYLDFEKAFDRVPLQRLTAKLEHVGIRGNVLAWITSFLNGREFYVRIADNNSKSNAVLSGVPQGSVLGPVLFTLFTADLPSSITSCISLYADDTKIFNNPLEASQEIQNDLNKIYDWTKKWLINLNINKCSVLHIGKRNPQLEYQLNDSIILSTESQIDLGITMKHNLKWDNHIINITRKANSMIYLVRKAFHHISPELFIKIYKSFIRPILEFGFQIWSPYFQKDIDLLEKTQRRATKILPHRFYNIPYEERLRKLKLPTLLQRRIRGDLIEAYKILNNIYSCPRINDVFTLSANVHLRGHQMKLTKTQFSSNPNKHFIGNRVVDLWNRLPNEVIESTSVNQFKNRLDSYLNTNIVQ